MPSFDINLKSDIDPTFRVQKIMSDFDVQIEHSQEHFKGEIKLPEHWQIGLIVGNSGTGKTTIAKSIWPDAIITSGFDYCAKSVVDDMPKASLDDISRMFYAVGFGSVPSWLKPYHALSNGEKMRVDLARALMERDFVVFDEFTSVVDRTVAKTMCKATNKAVRRMPEKKFIAVTCHHDVLEYLAPDWVFNTDTMTFSFMDAHPQSRTSTSESADLASGRNLGVITI